MIMSKRPTDSQIGAWQALNALCQQTARAVWLMSKAEGVVEKPSHADVLLEWYEALSAMREKIELDWPGVSRRHRLK
jgi:pyrroloquinoline quinone (PQQ) biosynthesis protein C